MFGLAIALRDLRVTQYDDAAITYRYAWNISHGFGWVYNVGDNTNGASSPLYTLILAFASILKFPIPGFSQAVGVFSYSGIVMLIYKIIDYLVKRLPPTRAPIQHFPLFSAISFTFSEGARTILLSGMESAFCSALGLISIYLMLNSKYIVSWFILGLAIFAKLDAVALLPTILILFLTVKVKTKKTFLVSGLALSAVPLTWFTFSFMYFGSIIPNSAIEKYSGEPSPNFNFNHLWVAQHLSSNGYLLMVPVLILISTPLFYKKRGLLYLAQPLSIIIWPILHGGFFSVINLGGQYDWYLGVMYAPVVVFIGMLMAYIACFSKLFRLNGLAALVYVLMPVMIFSGNNFKETASMIRNGHPMTDYEAFEKTRQDAGKWIGMNSQTGDVVATCFGWLAWGARENLISETCPLSTRKPVDSPTWISDSSFPGNRTPTTSPYGSIVKVFSSNFGAGGATWIIKTAK